MEFYHYFPSVTFEVLTAHQFVGRDDGLLEQQKHACLWISTPSWSINTQKQNLANIQPSRHHTWSKTMQCILAILGWEIRTETSLNPPWPG